MCVKLYFLYISVCYTNIVYFFSIQNLNYKKKSVTNSVFNIKLVSTPDLIFYYIIKQQ